MNRNGYGILMIAAILAGAAGHALSGGVPSLWPPQIGKTYPDIEGIDQTGQKVKLSSFKGRVILLEPVGMNCPMCQQFAGAGKYGGFGGIAMQAGIRSLEEWIPEFAGGISRDDPRYVYIQVLLFDMNMHGPTAADAKAWAAHFHMNRRKDRVVLAMGPAYLQQPYYQASYNLVPGLQLIDKNFVLRWDATSDSPKQSWSRDVLPNLARLLAE